MRAIAPLLTTLCLLSCVPEEEHHDDDSICANHEEHDHLETGLVKSSASFDCEMVSVNPTIPGEGFNIWQLEVRERGTDVVRDDLTLVWAPFMPEHEHGPSPTSSTFEDGVYDSGNLDFFMPGGWEVTVDIVDGETTESVVYTFCVE